MRAHNYLAHIVKLSKGFALASICVLVSSVGHATYYNLGAMIQGPKLAFTVQPSSSAYSGTAFSTQPSVSIVKPNGSVISTATDNVTLAAFTDSRCTIAAGGSLTASVNPKPAVSGVATFSALTYSATGKIYLKATAPGKKPVCSQAVIVTQSVVAGPDPAQFKLTLIGPNSIGTNICTAYTVALRDQFDGVVTATSTMTIKYNNPGSGSFYSDSGCSTSATQGTIATNASQTTVYYKSTVVEGNMLQVSDQASQVVDGSLYVNITGYKLQLTGPQTADNGSTCAGPYNISYLTAAGANAGITNVDITGYQGAIYSNSGCSTVISGSGPIATNSSGAASFYLLGPTTPPGVPMNITVSAVGAASASLAVGITTSGAVAFKLVISGSLGPVTGRCVAYTVVSQDASSNYQPVAANFTVNITENNNGAIYSDNTCTTAATSFTLPAGSGQLTFYFKDATAETTTLTAAASGLTSGTLSVVSIASGPVSPAVSAGTAHTCALLSDQTVKCWGDNSYGQLGNGTYTSALKPVLVQGLNGVTAISAGAYFTCALLTGGTVKCWGQGTSGQLGNATNNTSNIPVAVTSITSITAIAAGASHACAMSASTVYCWGLGANGQIGNSASASVNSPTATSTIGGTPLAIGAGDNHTCVVLAAGTIKCWGLGTSGQIGNGANSSVTAPTAVSSISSGATAVSGGAGHTCAVVSSAVKCWGAGTSGQLGDGASTNTNTPVSASGISTATAVSVGTNHTCALLSSNGVKCWGVDSNGELGNNASTTSPTPVDVSNLTTASAISAGDAHSCAVLSDQSVQCWGRNYYGQLGNGSTSAIATPTLAATPTGATAVSVGSSHVCALLSDKTVRCWGYNGNGQLGNGTLTTSFSPVTVSIITNANSISAGASFVCAVLSTQGIKCWGYNGFGQLGNNSTTTSMVPVDVSGISTATAVASGSNHACALLADQTVKCWGSGTNGQLGNNAGTQSNVPVSVSGITTAIAIFSGGNHSCALLANQTIKCWGLNASGQLGNNSTTNALVPVDVTGVTSAIALVSGTGTNHTCAVMSNQTVKCWGLNTTGQLGNNSLTNALTAVDVVGITTAYSVTIGGANTCALLSDKSARCWGGNANGQLGNGTTTNSSIPVTVLSSTPYTAISAGVSVTCGLQPDQRIKCNGANDYGQTLVNTLIPGYVLEIPQ